MRPFHTPKNPYGSRPTQLRLRRLGWVPALLALSSLPGCAQSGLKSSKQTQVGSLRETVSQLETEKSKLERQVAGLNTENQRLEDRLVQEQAHSDQLSARLDDTRKLTRGVDLDALDARTTASTRGSSPVDSSDRRTTPANQRGRKTPFAQIPGEIQPLNDSQGDSRSSSRPRTTPYEDEPASKGSSSSDLFSHQDSAATEASIRAARQRWLSLAQDSSAGSRTE